MGRGAAAGRAAAGQYAAVLSAVLAKGLTGSLATGGNEVASSCMMESKVAWMLPKRSSSAEGVGVAMDGGVPGMLCM